MDADDCLKVDNKLCELLIGNVPLVNLPMFFAGSQMQPSAPATNFGKSLTHLRLATCFDH
jgi:hypothetical protein